MRAPKNSREILSLSTDAQVILAAFWSTNVNSTLTLRNQASRLSDRGAVAMEELCKAGIIKDDKADDGYDESRTYRLTSHGAGLEFRKSLEWIESHGDFSLTTPITAGD